MRDGTLEVKDGESRRRSMTRSGNKKEAAIRKREEWSVIEFVENLNERRTPCREHR